MDEFELFRRCIQELSTLKLPRRQLRLVLEALIRAFGEDN